ncbi:RHS repeat domain-containing protein [Flavobacterium sp. T12S277]|uniref:RHS repeat domain-containing protein n=1 Tax=Flavobacterium sp. T12S277 TaxID=3402752 RepID=UPI003ADD6747
MKKYRLLLVLFFLISGIRAQTFNNENFIYTEAPQKAVQSSNYNTLSKTDIQRNISYFDGLGRLKQTIILNGGVNKVNHNLLDWKNNWTLGNSAVNSFTANGQLAENLRINGLNPFEKTDLLWRCVNDAVSDADGGWNTASIPIDKTKGYQYAVWVKRTGGQNGTTYHGTQNVVNLDGSANDNPYFWYGNVPALDTWYLMVGMIHPSTYTGEYSGISGVYDRTGNKVLSGTDFKWSSTTVNSYFRSYLYYATDVNVSQYFYSPVLQEIDGNQASISGLLNGFESSDIVSHIAYDAFGRQAKEHLPYVVSGTAGLMQNTAPTDVLNYYKTPKYENTPNPFSEKAFEPSPLNRVLKQAAPGTSWEMGKGTEIKIDYQTNTVADTVKRYQANADWEAALGLYNISFSELGTYAEKKLYKTITYDENSGVNPSETAGSTVEFKNKEGQVILKRTYDSEKRHDTYYVYDSYGNLTYVLPPKVTGTVNDEVLNGLCYQYKYDDRNRLVEKKLPGKQWEFMVYDQLDRPVATGPAFSPFKDETTQGWLITKYDAFGRPIYTGWSSSQTLDSATRKILQDAQNAATVLFETKQTSGTIDNISVFYSNTLAPIDIKLLTVNYYDDYNYPAAPARPETIEGQTALSNAKGLITGSWTRVLTTASETLGETTTIFYDTKARAVSTQTQNYLGGYTNTNSELDFIGKPIRTVTQHKRTAVDTELTISEKYTYSPQNRLLTKSHQINNGAAEVLVDNIYDELGQLITKKVGGNTQKIDYTYNIRGWLKEINKVDALVQGTDPKDLFAFQINYNNPTAGATALYNGNISETHWTTNSDPAGIIRSYGYSYDNLHRLKEAVYKKGTTLSNAYNEALGYDKNGNIIKLTRNGNSETLSQIDNLAYTYANSSNRLMKVMDSSDKTIGFKDITETTEDYSYDVNGNMTKDNNKNITAITYNHLNLPKKITFVTTGNIEYIYNANGIKLSKTVNKGTCFTTITDYLGGFQYESMANKCSRRGRGYTGVLSFFPTTEGYVEPSGSSYNYIYQYKDHLGNIRLSYDKTLAIKEENSYYPFGLKHQGYNTVVTSTNNGLKYKYNGKELQDELQLNVYDYGARNYDSALGRWMNIDPLAETSRRFSPYTYALNNPVYFIDPDGMEAKNSYVHDSQNINGRHQMWSDRHSGSFANESSNSSMFTNPELPMDILETNSKQSSVTVI